MDIFGKRFPWGFVLGTHTIREYAIVEAKRDGEISFHGYIDEKSTHNSWDSLDEALVGLIAFKHDGLNTQAGRFFCRGIGMYDQPSKEE